MRKVLKISALVVGVLFVLVVIREAFFSYTSYFVIVPGAKVYADGKPVSGWLHRGGKGHAFILTRGGSGKNESYWITLQTEKGSWISSCDDWSAPSFPLVAIGDVNPPCFTFALTEDPTPKPKSPERKLGFGPRFIEFTADDGSRLRTSW
jgi:hypothetical protein